MSIAEDYLPAFIFDEDDLDPEIVVGWRERDPYWKTCAFCGTRDLRWAQNDDAPSGWSLCGADGKLHRCLSPEVTADDFPAAP